MELGEIDHYLRELRRVLALGGRIRGSVLFAETDPYDNVTDFWHRPDDIIGLLDKRGFRWKGLGARRFGGHQNYFLLQLRQALEGA